MIEQFPDSWQSEWLRLRAQIMKDTRLAGWADYYEQMQSQLERKHLCAIA
jgi:hypothetical protein